MISRRSLILGAGAFLCTGRAIAEPYVIPAGNSLAFRVLRNDSEIGTHALEFEGDTENLTVRVTVGLAVGLGPITLFRYTHHATEIWRDGRVFSLEAETDDDGKLCKVHGVRTDDGFVVEGTKASRYVAPEDALPATHWNRRMLDGPMINTQYGDLMRPTVTPMGAELVPEASGGEIRAEHFALTGDAMLDTWYDEKSSWAALTFKASDKSEIRYARL